MNSLKWRKMEDGRIRQQQSEGACPAAATNTGFWSHMMRLWTQTDVLVLL